MFRLQNKLPTGNERLPIKQLTRLIISASAIARVKAQIGLTSHLRMY